MYLLDRTINRSIVLTMSVVFMGAIMVGKASGLQPQSTAKPLKRNDVILLTIDTLRPSSLSVYDSKSLSQTPNIDALAQDGVVYFQAYAPISVTGPSFTTLMTGQDLSSHGVLVNHYLSRIGLPDSSITLAETLRDRGYRTGAFISAFTLNAKLGLDQGFEVYDDKVGAQLRRRSDVSRERAVTWISTVNDPIFLWFHSFDTHGPLYQWLPDDEKPIITVKPRVPSDAQKNFSPAQIIGDLSDPSAYKVLYATAVKHTDEQIGVIVEELRNAGRYEDALIVVTADHGETFTERIPWFDHGTHPSQEQLHIPLIIKFPRWMDKTGWDKRTVALKDIAPTIAEITGSTGLQPDGRSLLDPAHRGWPVLVGESSHCTPKALVKCSPLGPLGKTFSARSPTHTVWLSNLGDKLEYRTYDRRTDPFELMPTAIPAPKMLTDTVNALRAKRWQELSTHPYLSPPQSSEHDDAMKSLGYVD
jgi:arylsulfatase A-like enzyme